MRVKQLLTALLLLSAPCFSLEKLPERYLVSYGDPQATIRITEYYSFNCPHCVALFQREFKELKATYLDTKRIAFTFHPIPMDAVTVCAMDCLEKLNDKEKRAFLEVILEAVEMGNSQLSIALMKKAMEVLKKPIQALDQETYLQETAAFQDSFTFVKQEATIDAVPTVEINGLFFPEELPDLPFLSKTILSLETQEKA